VNDRVTLFASWDRATQLQCLELLKRKPDRSQKLSRSQVDEIVRLYRDEHLGYWRIADLTGINFWVVKKIVTGKSYRAWTGGRLSNGFRPESVWRGGPKSYLESIIEEC
jgi:hypothetical protein